MNLGRSEIIDIARIKLILDKEPRHIAAGGPSTLRNADSLISLGLLKSGGDELLPESDSTFDDVLGNFSSTKRIPLLKWPTLI